MFLRSLLLAFLLLAIPAQAQQLPPDQAALKAHVQFLAADALHGREAGTRDFEIAAEYVAAQMLAAGLKPAGHKGGWFQPVRLVTFRPAERAQWGLVRGNTAVPFEFGVDFANSPVPGTPDFTAEGAVVFAGYGIVYPALGRDDYQGLDVRGKIVAILPGLPPGLPGEVEAHFGDEEQKARLAEARGAKAVIVLESAARRANLPFEQAIRYWDYERMTWAGPDGVAKGVSPRAPVVGYVSDAGAQKLFAGARIAWQEVLAAERAGQPIPTGALATRIRIASRARLRTTDSRNVVGLLEGADPRLKNQYVVLSAHLDHLGMGEAVDGDRIYNGAMDNAVGVGTILEIARHFAQKGIRPRRSILFVALTAEESGLIGSDYFVHHAPVPRERIVADLNIDMPVFTYPLEDLVVIGGERSSLGPSVAEAAKAEGLRVVPDPMPEEMFFVRSDHYSFVQGGIPAVSIDTGPGGRGGGALRTFLARHYHKPSDDLNLPWDWDSAARYLRVAIGVTRSVADADDRPRWNKGDFFGTLFEGYGAR